MGKRNPPQCLIRNVLKNLHVSTRTRQTVEVHLLFYQPPSKQESVVRRVAQQDIVSVVIEQMTLCDVRPGHIQF